jgi:hypothetical protein
MKTFFGTTVLLLGLVSGVAYGDQNSRSQLPASAEGVPPGAISVPTKVTSLAPSDVSQDHEVDIVDILQVFHAYVYYHDSGNGQALASLFTPDGVFDDLYNNVATGTLDPTKGVGGKGCRMIGRAQIAKYIENTAKNGTLQFPGHSHHMPTSEIVTVAPDGNYATMTANFITVSTNDATGAVSIGLTADYLMEFQHDKKAGWQIVRNLPINDSPGVSASCDLDGPIPRP